MKHQPKPLEDVHIASPCRADWDSMVGDERRRYCADCQLHVHNVAALPRDEAEALIAAGEAGREVCLRLEYHEDGSCVTSEEPSETPASMTPGRLTALALAAGALAACKSEEPRTPEEPIAVEATEVEDAGEAPKLQLQEPLLADMGEHPVRMGRICLTQGTEELEATGSPGEAESQEGPVILGKVDLSEGAPDNCPSSSGPAATDEAGPKRPPKRRVMLGSPAPPRPKE